jgi:hypothetical protein
VGNKQVELGKTKEKIVWEEKKRGKRMSQSQKEWKQKGKDKITIKRGQWISKRRFCQFQRHYLTTEGIINHRSVGNQQTHFLPIFVSVFYLCYNKGEDIIAL